ncbi:ABC transporter ATP-binding protein [Rhodospirillaceae bacterium SYSU D60014]|uniref:ABC transporter ATP-binding protein n=1 Tax=Virgifigura deserti TaxID=2268457 RepID=UPI000E675F22
MTVLLDVKDLRVRFRTLGAIRAKLAGVADPFLDAVLDVSFQLRAGTTFGLVGESGSGKSTLGRAILGLTPIESGTIRFDGMAPMGLSGSALSAYRRNAAMMFQDPVASLSPRLTVKALITEPFVIHGLKDRDLDAEARRLLDMVGLPANFAGRYPHQLSGGQARRVGVARALALEPKLIIADEPTAGLDVSVQGEILNLMARLQRELGLTYLIITHNLAVVRHICDEMAIMYMGRFVECGPTAEIFANPGHPYTHGLLAAQPHPDPDRRRQDVELKGEVPSLARRPSGCEFHTRCPRAKERCSTERPEPREIVPGQTLRCHYPLLDPAA